jgi:hypothetical protein
MESKQYRISPIIYRQGKAYRLQVTHGFMDVETLGVFPKQAQAREHAKAHAKRTGVKAIILT